MKRKLLLVTVLVALFVCVFALSVGAVTGSTSNEYGEVTYVDGINEVKDYDTTSRAVVKNTDGTYTTYPAYYVYNGSTGTNMKVDFTKLNNATGEGYTKASLIRIEVFEKSRLNWTFQDCSSLIDVYLPDSVYFHYASFIGCTSLKTVKIPSAATQIPTDCFSGCTSLESIEIPTTVKTLGARAFQNCNLLSVIKIPEGYTNIIPQDFRKITNGKATNSLVYIIPKSCTGINSQYSLTNCTVEKIIFTGDENSTFVADVKNDAPGWVSKIEYANHCEYYYDNKHDAEFGYVFTSFTDKCYTEGVCTRCGEAQKDEEFEPMFVFLGYSSDGKRICTSYIFNAESIDRYNEANDNDSLDDKLPLNFGFVASANNNTPINQDKTFAENSIHLDLTNSKYVSIDFVLKGDWSNEAFASAEISMNLYTFSQDEDGNTVISYIYGEYAKDAETGEYIKDSQTGEYILLSKVYSSADKITYNQFN